MTMADKKAAKSAEQVAVDQAVEAGRLDEVMARVDAENGFGRG